jgi:Fic-DOC domain mobile mystery protein B
VEASLGEMILFEFPPGATPLDLDEAEGLIPTHIMIQSQLNEWEQYNILEAERWLGQQKLAMLDVITEDFARKLHQRMFAKTWRWAGKFRQSNKNIGVDWLLIPIELRNFFADAKYQIEYKIYTLDEFAVRFHHRLVSIHPFVNGNGRHSRLLTDAFLLSQAAERFSWGSSSNLIGNSSARDKYITALRHADKGNYQLLIDFVRS